MHVSLNTSQLNLPASVNQNTGGETSHLRRSKRTRTLNKTCYNDEQFLTTTNQSLRKLVYKQLNKSVSDEMPKEVTVNHVDVSPDEVASNSQPVSALTVTQSVSDFSIELTDNNVQ